MSPTKWQVRSGNKQSKWHFPTAPVSTGTPARPCSTSGSPSHARGSSTRNQKSGRSTFKYFSNNNTNDTCWSVDLTRLSQYPSFSCLPHTSSGYPAICGIQLDFFTNSWTDLHTSLFKQLLSILKEGCSSLQEVNEDTGVPPNLKEIGHWPKKRCLYHVISTSTISEAKPAVAPLLFLGGSKSQPVWINLNKSAQTNKSKSQPRSRLPFTKDPALVNPGPALH